MLNCSCSFSLWVSFILYLFSEFTIAVLSEESLNKLNKPDLVALVVNLKSALVNVNLVDELRKRTRTLKLPLGWYKGSDHYNIWQKKVFWRSFKCQERLNQIACGVLATDWPPQIVRWSKLMIVLWDIVVKK